LPIDPTNQLPGSYYSYATNGTKYELTTSMESTNNKYNGINDRTSTDGGTSYAMYEIGSDLSINPQNSVLLNLVAYWKFNETSGNAIDSIGGLSATNNNVTYATGFKGNAAVFNGSNSYLRATLAMSSGAGSADSFAIWVYQTGAQNHPKGLMNSGYAIHLWENVNRTIIYGNWTSVTNEQFNSTGTILDNQWNLVVVTSLSAGSSKCYINGVLAGQNNISGNLVNAGYIEFGRHPNYNDNYFNGKLDNAGYWNRVLSQDEVKLLYGAGAGLSYP
jgi:hypothetical protein